MKPRTQNPKFKTKGSKNSLQPTRNIVPKAMARTRADVLTWKSALAMAENIDNPKLYPYYNLVKDMLLDAHTTSQIKNRKLKTLSANFSIKKANGETHTELTSQLQKSVWFGDIIGYILDSEYFGYTLIELNRQVAAVGNDGVPFSDVEVTLVPRQNVIPQKGIILKDYTYDKGLDYLNASEYGTWLLDFGGVGDLGLINKAIPHILFSRFAQSCWSELCEIYGIPPRVMKTNTRDRQALNRAERMMTDMGAAAWFIIDETEQFEWATTGVPSTGEVYDGLIKLCRDNISLLISGAIIGQDTKYGSKGKEVSSQDMLQALVDADQTMVEQYMNDKVLPALYAIGVLPEEGLSLVYDQVEDLGELWTRTKEILPYKEVPDDWIKEKFGIEVIGNKAPTTPQKLSLDFFD
ncbi:phage portal protein family protein [Capnocytophaga granulosa]